MSSSDLTFDLEALTNPKTPADLIACCNEALSELAMINDHLDSILDGAKNEREKDS